MATWLDGHWESSVESGVPRRDRRSGPFSHYLPDHLSGWPVVVDDDLSAQLAQVEREVRALNEPGAEALAGVARFLLRSEAIASSRIEGLAPSSQQVALAELGRSESVQGVSQQAQLVANNMTIVRDATTALVEADEVTVEHVVDLQRALLPDDPRHHGLREVQNWIGGSDWHPIDADFVPPTPDRVPVLMADLMRYLNGAAHSPLLQAALVHAQFETIHPFTDGNGRVGRALIHTVLARRGLTTTAVLPVSLVLATLRDEYVAGLTAFRHSSPPGSTAAVAGMTTWLTTFVGAAGHAAAQSRELVAQINDLRTTWTTRLADHRTAQGVRAAPRVDSVAARLLATLPETPVLTGSTVQRMLDVSPPRAQSGLAELHAADILDTRRISHGATAYLATEVLDLVTLAERRLASTKFDTRTSDPNRPVPARPQREEEP